MNFTVEFSINNKVHLLQQTIAPPTAAELLLNLILEIPFVVIFESFLEHIAPPIEAALLLKCKGVVFK